MIRQKKNRVVVEYFCKFCKTKGSSLDVEKTKCPHCEKEIKVYRREI